eukprot:10693181-Lingulodinium_polyedra.AAC.1
MPPAAGKKSRKVSRSSAQADNIAWMPVQPVDTPNNILAMLNTTGKKLPKAVAMARDKLAQAGRAEITADAIKAVLSAKEYNALSNSYRTSMNSNVKTAYSALSTDAARRAWVAQYVIDPVEATTVGFNKLESINSNMCVSTET